MNLKNNIFSNLFIIACLFIVSSCSSLVFKDFTSCKVDNISKQQLYNTYKTQNKFGTPISLQLAIIYQESSFKKYAKPKRKKIFGFIPSFQRISSAKGYSQALDATWDDYKKANNRIFASRYNFADSSDFIGWYTSTSRRKLNLNYNNVRDHYLAYHEGHGGFAKKTYLKKPGLVDIANKVAANANRYEAMLRDCNF